MTIHLRPIATRSTVRSAAPVLAALLLLGLPSLGVASASTDLTNFSPTRLEVRHGASPTVPVLAGLPAEVRVLPTMAAARPAGTGLSGGVGVAGTSYAVPSCPTSSCQTWLRGADAGPLTPGDAALSIPFTFVQPPSVGGHAFGFWVQVAVLGSGGWTCTAAYLSSGLSTVAGGAVVTAHLVLDLGPSSGARQVLVLLSAPDPTVGGGPR